MMWQSVKDTERFDFVPKTKVIYIPLGQFSWSYQVFVQTTNKH